MPNWCSTTYAIKGNGLPAFKEKMNEVIRNLALDEEEHFVHYVQLNDLLDAFGHTEGTPLRKDLYFRGCVTYYEDNGCYLTVDSEDAWGPQNEVFDIILTDYPDVDYVYLAEETGCSLYINTDETGEYFDYRYHVEYVKDDNYEVERFATKKEAYEWLKEIAGVNDIEELKEGDDYYIDEYEQA